MKQVKVDPFEYILRNCNKKAFEAFINSCPILDNLKHVTQLLKDSKDISGFSKFDASVADEVAWRDSSKYSQDKMLRWAVRLLKYKNQLKSIGIDYPRYIFLDESEYNE